MAVSYQLSAISIQPILLARLKSNLDKNDPFPHGNPGPGPSLGEEGRRSYHYQL
jgi:hypothetical protein